MTYSMYIIVSLEHTQIDFAVQELTGTSMAGVWWAHGIKES